MDNLLIIYYKYKLFHCTLQVPDKNDFKKNKKTNALVLLKDEESGRHKTVHLLPACSDFEERRQEASIKKTVLSFSALMI